MHRVFRVRTIVMYAYLSNKGRRRGWQNEARGSSALSIMFSQIQAPIATLPFGSELHRYPIGLAPSTKPRSGLCPQLGCNNFISIRFARCRFVIRDILRFILDSRKCVSDFGEFFERRSDQSNLKQHTRFQHDGSRHSILATSSSPRRANSVARKRKRNRNREHQR